MTFNTKTNPFSEDYIITRDVLGLGISGKVIACINKKEGSKYAVKTLKDSAKARREITLQWKAGLNCPYIVKIKDVYENVIQGQSALLVVMECMEGGELFAKISNRTGPFTENEVAKIMHQICSAVKHIHDMGIAHRDLKPENLLLSSNNHDAVIKLTDFGFAKETTSGLQTPCYTPYYVAPEVLASEKYDVSCDIWSLGVIMYILICGYPPFYSSNGKPISPGMKKRIRAGDYKFPEEEWGNVSFHAKDLIKKMLETTPEKRISINDVMDHAWISCYIEVPNTPLLSVKNLREEPDQWPEIRNVINSALTEMRVDTSFQIKDINTAENPLLKRRMEKAHNLQAVMSESKTPTNLSRSASPTNFS